MVCSFFQVSSSSWRDHVVVTAVWAFLLKKINEQTLLFRGFFSTLVQRRLEPMFFISNPTELQYKLFTVDEFPEKCLWAPDMSQAAGLVAGSQLVKLIRYNSES